MNEPTLPKKVRSKLQYAEKTGQVAELGEEEFWALVEYECALGGVTVDELREIRRSGIWPEGKTNIYALNAELLLGMAEG